MANGTTTATYFATIHLESSEILADLVTRIGQRAFIGKVNMNFECPEGLQETTEDSYQRTEDLIKLLQRRNVSFFYCNSCNRLINSLIINFTYEPYPFGIRS